MDNTVNIFPTLVDEVLNGFDKREKKYPWVGIIIHHTGIGNTLKPSEALWKKWDTNIAKYLAKKDNQYVSAHFQISREGRVTQIINPDQYVAYHAGKSSHWHPIKRKVVTGWNNYAIGIELLGDGNKHKYSDEQMTALAELCKVLWERYDTIDPQCIVGHEVVSPGRKNDPGIYFDWRMLYERMFLYM